MSAVVDQREEARRAALADAQAPSSAGARQLVATPILIVVALAALYAYVSSQQLDSIEQRFLTADVLLRATGRHVFLASVSTVIVVALAVPAGILLTRPFARPLRPPLLALANIGQCVPSIGVLAILALAFTGIGLRTVFIGLVAYTFLPIVRNTMVGLQQVDPAIIEAGRGMGLTKGAVLRRIELPLAVPVMLAGIRTALVITVGTAALATFVNGGGLGDIINQGLVQSRDVITLTGGVLTGALALLIDWLASLAEGALRPKGL
jgi:osmoprotectant transport system permease protein